MLVTKHDWSVKKSPGCAHVQVRIQMNQCTYQTENQDLNHTSKMRFPPSVRSPKYLLGSMCCKASADFPLFSMD